MNMSSIIGAAASKAGRPSGGASDPWDDLYNAPSTITPLEDFHADSSFWALISGEVSGLTGAWASTSSAQSAAARRPHADVANNLIQFDASNTEWLDASGLTQASGNVTIAAVYDQQSDTAADQYLIDIETGRLIAVNWDHSEDTISLYNDTFRVGNPASTGKHHAMWINENGADKAFTRLDGVKGTVRLGIARAIGGAIAIGARYDASSGHVDINLKCLPIYAGVDATDTTAIEFVLNTIKGTLP